VASLSDLASSREGVVDPDVDSGMGIGTGVRKEVGSSGGGRGGGGPRDEVGVGGD
jgi:hypothetical protein